MVGRYFLADESRFAVSFADRGARATGAALGGARSHRVSGGAADKRDTSMEEHGDKAC